MQNSPNKRYFYGLDELRAALMLVGVFWHVVSIVAPFGAFVYDSKIHESFALYALIYPEHIFRMEAFFLVSGFLSRMVIMRKSKALFFEARVKRVLIPLLFGCFGVNFLLQLFGSQFMNFSWERFDMWRWVMHGWFLITLFMCALIDLLLPKEVFMRVGMWSLVLVFVIGSVGYTQINYWNGQSWHFFGPVAGNLFNFFVLNTIQFFPFYFLGSWLYCQQNRLDSLGKKTLFWALMIGLFAGVLEYVHSLKLVDVFGKYPWSALLYRVNHMIAAGGIAVFLFLLFYRTKRKGNKIINYLMTSAIVIYLVHHPLVIILGWALDYPALSNLAYYGLVVIITLALSYLAYEGIRRVQWLRFAFGLKNKDA